MAPAETADNFCFRVRSSRKNLLQNRFKNHIKSQKDIPSDKEAGGARGCLTFGEGSAWACLHLLASVQELTLAASSSKARKPRALSVLTLLPPSSWWALVTGKQGVFVFGSCQLGL